MNLGKLKQKLAEFDNDELEVMVTTGGYNESLYEVEKIAEQISKNPNVPKYEYILIVG